MKDKELREYLGIEASEIGLYYFESGPVLHNEIIECEECEYLIKKDKAYKKVEVKFDPKKKEDYCIPHYYCKKCYGKITTKES